MADSVSSEFELISANVEDEKCEGQECAKNGITTLSIADLTDQHDAQLIEQWQFTSQYSSVEHNPFKMLEKQVKLLEENNALLREKAQRDGEEKEKFKIQIENYREELKEAIHKLDLIAIEILQWKGKSDTQITQDREAFNAQVTIQKEQIKLMSQKVAMLDLQLLGLQPKIHHHKLGPALAQIERKMEEPNGQLSPIAIGSLIGNETSKREPIKYTPDQLCYMEQVFASTTYPEQQLYAQVAHHVQKSEAAVQTWFKNRRAKSRHVQKTELMLDAWREKTNDEREQENKIGNSTAQNKDENQQLSIASEAEHKLSLANTEISQWKSKFDAEVALHHEEVEDLHKKMVQKEMDHNEQMETMSQKISELEKTFQSRRLQSEFADSFLVDESGREWELEEVLLGMSKNGLGFSISGGRDREIDPVYNDRHIRVTYISPGGTVQRDGRILVGDVILQVNDSETVNCTHSYAVEAIKNAGTFVRLVGPKGKPDRPMDNGTCWAQLVKRLKPTVVQRLLSQSHLSEPILACCTRFQSSASGVASGEKTVEQKEALARENKKLQDDLHEAKEALADANRKLNRAHRALDELQALRIEMERRLQEKEEEIENLRKNMQFEIDRLTAALVDAEARMKAEVSRLKKKYQETEHKLSLANTEISQWKSKFDAEVALHHEEVEDLHKKMVQKEMDHNEQMETMSQKISELEKAKLRLQSEVEMLAELPKMKHLYEKVVEQKEALAYDIKKLQGPTASLSGFVTVSEHVKSMWLTRCDIYLKFTNWTSKPISGIKFSLELENGVSIIHSWNLEPVSGANNEYTLPSWFCLAPGQSYTSTGMTLNKGDGVQKQKLKIDLGVLKRAVDELNSVIKKDNSAVKVSEKLALWNIRFVISSFLGITLSFLLRSVYI